MTPFQLKKGKNTPAVDFNKGVLGFSGVSYPEDARTFYMDVTSRLLEQKELTSLNIILDFEYLSSSSVACILQLIKDVQKRFASCKISLNLHHDKGDDDMISIGENFNQLAGIPVKYVER